jgi:hypothetical protein
MAACLSPERAEIIARCCHTLVLDLSIADSDIAVVLSTCMNLKNLILVAREDIGSIGPFKLHTPRTLKRLVIDWSNQPSFFNLAAVVPQLMLTNLTHLSIRVVVGSVPDIDNFDHTSWTPLRSSSLQCISLELLGDIRAEQTTVMDAILAHSPPSLKALVFVVWFNWGHSRRDLDAIDQWFAHTTESEVDPALKSVLGSIAILAGVTLAGWNQRPRPVEHSVWDRAFMITRPQDHWRRPYYADLCEGFLQDNELTLWEAAELALAERRTQRRL